MRKLNVENGLAVLGAIVVLVGVVFAAEDALAGSAPLKHADAVRLPSRIVSTENAERQASMAAEAAAAVEKAVQLDLDIRLRDTMSVADGS